MNRLKQLREEKGLTQEELAQELKVKGLYIAKQEINAYEIYQLRLHNNAFWSRVADYFNVTIAYLMGDSKIPNEDYIVDLQEVLHREYELKLEKAKLEKDLKEALDRNLELEQENVFLRKENQDMTNDLYNIDVVVNDFKERNHIDS
ncbi:helix-turn-helix domain-containing protein [Streptococcus parauberis]|uniref:DNA-binding helix-turn-helix protein n=1 Tax=Streptococcus parauberis NCFD 2020 TaxID=873447 RepID=F1Z0Y4_9STRE|nr:helix-turn-helix transcriptional regulator [Streptococcus parauberis]EGE53159.1 DNA-binding helix-turn-helix protein [Streptococcus parauberis NCFD 2020]QBX18306.1 hypothetical protein Javan411_0010 [Streptococcus phage Javan411]QBX27641.1 hypothetical protein Javan400_0043 [Streptococcus phage Javan400]